MVAGQTADDTGRHEERGGLFVLSAGHLSAEDLDALQRAARVILVSKHGSLAEQVARAWRPTARPRAVGDAHIPAGQRTGQPANSQARIFQRPGRVCRGRSRVRHHSTESVNGRRCLGSNVDRQRAVRISGFGIGVGLHWSLEQQREPDHAMVERSRSAIGLARRCTFETKKAGVCGARQRCRSESEASPATSPVTGRGTVASSTRRTASTVSCSNSCQRDDPVKISRPDAGESIRHYRHLSVTAYVEWVLGARGSLARLISSRRSIRLPVRCSRATLGTRSSAERVAFFDMGGRQTSWTADRREFIGRNGTLGTSTRTDRGTPLSGRVGGGLDPCAVLQTALSSRRAQAQRRLPARTGCRRRRRGDACRALSQARSRVALAQVTEAWDERLE